MMFPILLTRDIWFPHPDEADSQGLLAIGGDLSPERLLLAYISGIFPWYSPGDPILWWSPDPRMVLFPEELHIPKRLSRILRQGRFKVSMDRDFEGVIRACAVEGGRSESGTWITQEMVAAYMELHRLGFAHSVEAWQDGRLAGGLYGVCLGRVFFGESMFFREPDASKVAFVTLVKWLEKNGVELIDCQVRTGHLERFGARDIPRNEFLAMLERLCSQKGPISGHWDTLD